MSFPPRILSLNLGSQSLGLAEFCWKMKGGLILNGFRFREILVDAGAEGMRPEQIELALREMVADLGIRCGEISYAVSNQSVFARFVKLPVVDEEKIERIIQFEAQQNVPSPIDEVIWDYQIVSGEVDEQIQVVLVAIKLDLLETINTAVERAGGRTLFVDVATMALYNAFRHNYSDLSGCSLLVDIGARTTNLLFIEPGKVFSRSIAIGGRSISSAIAKEFKEPLPAAESRKKREGFLHLAETCAESASPEVIRASNIVRGTLSRLHAELMRSISHYRGEQQGKHPERLFLAGGGASAAHISEFFREKMQVPVEFFNPLRNIATANAALAAEAEKSSHLLGGLVGIALRRVMHCPIELDLAPPSVRRARELAQRRPYFVLAAACLVLGLLAWSAYYARAERIERHVLKDLQGRVHSMRLVETEMEKVRGRIAGLESEAMPLLAIIRERNFWLQVLEDLNARLPKENIWITELVPTSNGLPVDIADAEEGKIGSGSVVSPVSIKGSKGKSAAPMFDGIYVRGLYLFNPKQQEVVIDYFRNLIDSPYFRIDPSDQSRVIRPTMPNSTEWAFPYELSLELRSSIRVP